MITVICSSKYEQLLTTLNARISKGKWTLPSLSDSDKKFLEEGGSIIEGCKYLCWGEWFSNIYWVTRDPRCTVSFNTLSKRANGLTKLDEVVIGRAKSCKHIRRRGISRYQVTYNGITYPSESAIARAFGVDVDLYKNRRQRGWSIEESLKCLKVQEK